MLILAYVGSNITTANACTIFTFSRGDTVFFGNNEDYYNRSDVIYFVPSDGENYGAVYLGQKYSDRYNPQGGMNEMGLAFDANAIRETSLNEHQERPEPRIWLAVMMIEECATVEEAVEMALSYRWGASMAYQLHLADATGDAVVIGPGPDGEIVFTRMGGEGILVSTNFNLAAPGDSPETCWRYRTAFAMLGEIEGVPDIGEVSTVLEAVNQKGEATNTVYSNVFDTRNKVAYVYYYHQFEEAVTIDLQGELEKGFHSEVIGQLFSQETRNRARAEAKLYEERKRASAMATIGGASMAVGVAFIALAVAVLHRRSVGDGDASLGSTQGVFDWRRFLRPSLLKLVVTLIIPSVVAVVVTRRSDTVLDFYGYLLTPRLALWTGEGIVYVFNRYVLLWIPFYLFACTVSIVISRSRAPQSADSGFKVDA
jgi:hypothetical protein